MNRPSETDSNITEGLYRFKAPKSGEVYFIRVEKHPKNFYVVKYHLKKHKLSKHKYHILTNLNEASRIIHTCIKVMLDIADKDEHSSFGFIGSNTVGSNYIEDEADTKRFKTYKYVMLTYFSENIFKHKFITEKSTYLMIRKSESCKNHNLINETEIYLADFYNDTAENL